VAFIVDPPNLPTRGTILEHSDHIGRRITLAQNPPQCNGFAPVRGSEYSCVIVANNYWGFEVDVAYARQPQLYDLVAIF
jgi:hypothetical protein